MFGKLFGWGRRPASSRPLSRRPRYRPYVQAFEERVLLSTFTWDVNGDGNFNNAANWVDQNNHHGVPGAV